MRRTALPLLGIFVCGIAAMACNIPVFRYALERWQPDPVEVIVFYDSDLSEAQEKAFISSFPDSVRKREGSESQSNDSGPDVLAKLVRCDLRKQNVPHRELWEQRLRKDPSVSLPYVVVRSNLGSARRVTVWQGAIHETQKWSVFESPARSELAKRLLAGDAVVWLLVTGGNTAMNASARTLLQTELPKLENKIQLPDGIGLPGSELYSEVPLLVRFSFLEVKRSDPKESFLTEFVSQIRPDAVASDVPVIVPVFGRGRALEVIPSNDLSPQLMTDLTLFLSGACSCQVKDQNPGFDLLLSADWNGQLFEQGVLPPARVEGRGKGPQLLDIPRGK